MPKKEIPIRLVIQGTALAYSEEQIEDTVRQKITDIEDLLFGYYRIPYTLAVGNKLSKESRDYGVSKDELIEKIAIILYEERANFCKSITESMSVVSQTIMSSSGWIKRDERVVDASTKLDRLINHINNNLVEFRSLEDQIQNAYRVRARELLRDSIWHYTLVNDEEQPMGEMRKCKKCELTTPECGCFSSECTCGDKEKPI